jgi:hypothetical protein
VLDELECGETVPSAGRHFHINKSTVELLKKVKQPLGLALKQEH